MIRLHRKHRSSSSKKDMNSNSSTYNNPNNSSTNTSNTNSNVKNNNCVDNVVDNIQNINNIVGCNTNESGDTASRQENSNQNNNTTSNTSNNTSNINTQNSVNNTNNNLQNINTIILSGIEDARAIQSYVPQTTSTPSSSKSTTNTSTTTNTTTPPSTTDAIDKASTTLQDINNIKSQLARLDLDPRQLAYYENAIAPLLTTLLNLSTVSYDLASSASTLASSPVVCAKHSKLKDTIHLVYDINDECEDVFKALRKRIDLLIDLT